MTPAMSMTGTMQATPFLTTSAGFSQVRTPLPLGVPSLAQQSINPNFRLAPNLTIGQAAFNISTIGQALQQVPPFAFRGNPFAFGGGFGNGFGASPFLMAGYGGISPYYASPYMMGGYGGYGGAMMTANYAGGYGSSMLADPYANTMSSTGYSSASYPQVATTTNVTDAKVVLPAANTTLVSNSSSDRPLDAREIWIYDDYFSPTTTWIRAGTSIRWINYSYHEHSITSTDRLWDSGPLRRGAEFRLTFTEPGTYQYMCRYHSGQMAAKIIVSK
jgi:plastocyanin